MHCRLLHTLRTLTSLCLVLLASWPMAGSAQVPDFPAPPEDTIKLPDGRNVEIYKATVQRVSGNRLTVRFAGGLRHTYQVPSEYRFNVGGREVRARDLQRGDELTAYITRQGPADHELVVLEENAATGSYEVVQSVVPDSVTDVDALPETAGRMPAVFLLGLLLTALGAAGLRRGQSAAG